MKSIFCHHINISLAKVCLFFTGLLLFPPIAVLSQTDRDFLDAGQIAGVAAGSAAAFTLGSVAERAAEGDSARWTSPFLFEGSLQRALGGGYYPDKTNFLDGTKGSAYTAAGAALILLSADLAWAEDNAGAEAAENLFLYFTGITATKGVTSMAKGLFRRKRPMVVLEPELAKKRSSIDIGFDNRSFFSGHTSSAFFASTFLNLRLRALMRQELTDQEYRNWCWAPPTLLFSWASFVGWSRMHAYKHFFFDVVAGAVVGTLMAELFYSFQQDGTPLINNPDGKSGRVLQVSIRF